MSQCNGTSVAEALETAVFVLFVGLAATLAAEALLRFFDLPLVRWAGLPVAGSAFAATFLGGARHSPGGALLALALMFAGGVYGLWLRGLPDLSWDGQAYHLPSILDLLAGVNPVTDRGELLWREVYPNGLWTLHAMLGSLLADPEAGRALLPVLSVAVAGYLAVCLRRDFRLRAPVAVVLASACVANPVVASQWLIFYLDGYLYLFSLLALFATQAALRGDDAADRSRSLWIAGAALVLLINAKTTGVYFAPVAIVGAFALAFRQRRRSAWRMAGILAGVGLFALLVVGWKPYATNLVHHGFPLYPPPWAATDYLSGQRPDEYRALSPVARFFASHFRDALAFDGRSFATFLDHKVQVAADGQDARRGGFGPAYPMLLGSALLAFALTLMARPARRRADLLPSGLAALALFGACLLFPESWWARLIPLLWLVPMLLFLAVWLPNAAPANAPARRGARSLAWCATLLAIGWTMAVFITHVSAQFAHQRHMAQLLERWPATMAIDIVALDPHWRVNNHSVNVWRARLARRGIAARLETRVGVSCAADLVYEGANVRLCQTAARAAPEAPPRPFHEHNEIDTP